MPIYHHLYRIYHNECTSYIITVCIDGILSAIINHCIWKFILLVFLGEAPFAMFAESGS